ncbi:MAG: cytidylate kinase-like family protein [Planctomycetota bacterium]
MPGRNPTQRPDIARVVEKQMRMWELARAQRPGPEQTRPTRQVEEFVTISRQVGAGGHDVASRLATRLDWPVFDREILQAMAGDDQVRTRLYESLDERDRSWLEDALRWALQKEFRKDDYFRHLGKTILTVARQGHAIFLGRGADLMLPRERGLRVHLFAPQEVCVQRFAQRHNLDEAQARTDSARLQRDRTDFLRRYFGNATVLPERHDIVLNTATLEIDHVVELIMTALRNRGIVT